MTNNMEKQDIRPDSSIVLADFENGFWQPRNAMLCENPKQSSM